MAGSGLLNRTRSKGRAARAAGPGARPAADTNTAQPLELAEDGIDLQHGDVLCQMTQCRVLTSRQNPDGKMHGKTMVWPCFL